MASGEPSRKAVPIALFLLFGIGGVILCFPDLPETIRRRLIPEPAGLPPTPVGDAPRPAATPPAGPAPGPAAAAAEQTKSRDFVIDEPPSGDLKQADSPPQMRPEATAGPSIAPTIIPGLSPANFSADIRGGRGAAWPRRAIGKEPDAAKLSCFLMKVYSLPPTEPLSGVRVTTQYQYYDVAGITPDAIIRDAMLKTPGPRSGRRDAIGLAAQELHAGFGSETSWTGCVAHIKGVLLTTTIYLPRWPGRQPANLAPAWDRFSAAIQKHQEAHLSIDIQGANQLYLGVTQQDIDGAECGAAAANTKALMLKVKSDTEAKNLAFDQKGEPVEFCPR